jgi:hypothetical protein
VKHRYSGSSSCAERFSIGRSAVINKSIAMLNLCYTNSARLHFSLLFADCAEKNKTSVFSDLLSQI